MNVSIKNNDAISGIIKVDVEKNDYSELMSKNLQKIRQQVNMPGFRKGMVPIGLVKKLYGKQAMAEEVNKLVSEKMYSFIREGNINILGDPIPNETEQKKIDFDVDENFEFCFDVALAPEINVKLSKKDKLTSYLITVDDKMVGNQIESYCKNYGSYEKVEKVEVEDLVKGVIVELEGGKPKPAGILIEDAVLMPSYIKGKMEQKKFLGAKVESKIIFNPFKAYKGAEVELASFLKINKDEAKEMKSDFSFEIKEITRHKKAELNQELFDRVFGENAVSDEAGFKEKITETIKEQFAPQSEYKFIKDMHDLIVRKIGDVAFADDILKRWLLIADEKNTKESIEENFPKIVEDLKYHLAKENLVKENDIKVEKEDIEAVGRRVAKMQFVQYGMLSVPDNILDSYVKEMMEKKETVNNLVDRAIDDKLSAYIKNRITVNEKEVTSEEFGKLLDEKVES